MAGRTNRRRFIKTSAAISAGYWVAGGIEPRASRAANEKIQFACVGVEGKGRSDTQDAGRGGDVVAICDIDETRLNAAALRNPNAQKFFDYREMFTKMGDKIDAFTVSTPDHCHAVIAAMGMKMGKHAFVQKPMTRTLFEVRTLAQIAAEKKLATQMGNQGTANRDLREAAAIIKSGAVGTVKEVHVWTNRPIWDTQGMDKPTDMPAVPATVHWDEWIGPAEMRPYHPAYHPFKWRGWWDFGTGALGDMACHTLNMPFMALDLRDPTSVQAVTSGHNMQSYPGWSIITCEMPERNGRAALKFMWYDGGKRPDTPEYKKAEEVCLSRQENEKSKDRMRRTLISGAFILGDKGWLLAPGDYAGSNIYMPEAQRPKVDIETPIDHFEEWVRAIKGGPPATSNFPNYAGPLTETVLLGNLAVWAAAGEQDAAKRAEYKEKGFQGKKIEWDAKNLVAKNAPEVASIIKPQYRNGYTL
jgi:predicted dehydrogenase